MAQITILVATNFPNSEETFRTNVRKMNGAELGKLKITEWLQEIWAPVATEDDTQDVTGAVATADHTQDATGAVATADHAQDATGDKLTIDAETHVNRCTTVTTNSSKPRQAPCPNVVTNFKMAEDKVYEAMFNDQTYAASEL